MRRAGDGNDRNDRPRALLAGGSPLLARCADELLQRGYELVGVVACDDALAAWAEGRGVPTLAAADLAAEAPRSELALLIDADDTLAATVDGIAERTVRFHDDFEPAYAGAAGASWSILDGRESAAVGWSERGDVTVSERLPLAPDESAISLRVKRHAAGLRSFTALLDGAATPNGEALGRATVDDRRLDGAGSLDWSAAAADLDRLARALDHGPLANPVALPTLWLGGEPMTVDTLRTLATRSERPPGTIVASDADSVRIASGTVDVEIAGLRTLDGTPIATSEIARRGYALGDALRRPDADERSEIDRRLDPLRPHESHWVRTLANRSPVEIPYARRGSQTGVHLRTLTPGQGVAPDTVAAAFALYLARISGTAAFTIAVRLHGRDDGTAAALLSPRLPFAVVVDEDLKPQRYLERFSAALDLARERRGYALDLLQRTPELDEGARRWQRVRPEILVDFAPVDADATDGDAADLTLRLPPGGAPSLQLRAAAYDAESADRIERQLGTLLAGLIEGGRPLAELDLLPPEERDLLERVNATAVEVEGGTLHRMFEAQVARTPDAVALIVGDRSLTYAELDERANRVAHELIARGVAPRSLVGLLLERTERIVVAMLATLKAGCAYVPLDPEYPHDRLRYMVEDSGLVVLLSEGARASELGVDVPTVALDGPAWRLRPSHAPDVAVGADDLAYVIYTSGSTGRPKGVMIEHGNCVNFFVGMDARVPRAERATWLAVTSISFDISVLELIWTLCRGYEVVLYQGSERQPHQAASERHEPIDLSLFYFSSDEGEFADGGGERAGGKYELLLEGARFADRHGFSAVWTPERHFHAFGGLYPNPSVTSAAVAAITERVGIRSGSVVVPLHHPIRIAEEWSVVDNLSNGRVGLSFASGWQPNDFAIRPESYDDRHALFADGIDQIRRLWRGETLPFEGPKGTVEVQTLPRPVQSELPFWVTAAGNPETFRRAGAMGANLLTHLLGQSVDEVAEKIALYRSAWREAGHEGEGTVSLMLHTFVAEDEAFVREQVREPLKAYLASSLDLMKTYASAVPLHADASDRDDAEYDAAFEEISSGDLDALLENAFERYYRTSGLFGTPEQCIEIARALQAKGVDEIACLIDFGLPSATVLDHLPHLERVLRGVADAPAASIPELIRRHGVSHLQVTPSRARMLYDDPDARETLASLDTLLIGGEAFPPDLAAALRGLLPGAVDNMYGPTETTIWSATHTLAEGEETVSIGTPIANTQIYIVDERLRPLPEGVPGELLIGGHGVGRGYHDRPDLTAERFVPDRIGPDPTARLYRTGDLARWSRGRLEFLGRLDHQIKLRGYRIELGEIEAALVAHPRVRQAVAVAREDRPGDKRLVAYLIAEGALERPRELLRGHLESSLPDFMIPGAFVVLPSFPLTPNGKVDRKALPAPEVEVETTFTPPSNALEIEVAEVWKEVLDLPTISSEANFFDLGGHSLLLVRTLSVLRDKIEPTLQMTDLFRFPTVASLADHVAKAASAAPSEAVAAVEGRSRASSRRALRQRRGRRQR